MKKGQYDVGKKAIMLILALFLFVGMIIYAINYFGGFKGNVFEEVSSFENDILVHRLIGSKSCFAYYDEDINKVYPGIIDIEKFNGDRLRDCLYYGGKEYAVENGKKIYLKKFIYVTLKVLDDRELEITNVMGQKVKRLKDLSEEELKQEFLVDNWFDAAIKRYVLIWEGDELKRGVLAFEIY